MYTCTLHTHRIVLTTHSQVLLTRAVHMYWIGQGDKDVNMTYVHTVLLVYHSIQWAWLTLLLLM